MNETPIETLSPPAGLSPEDAEGFAGVLTAKDLEPVPSGLSPELTDEIPGPAAAEELPASPEPAAQDFEPLTGAPAAPASPAARDYTAEVRELLDARPELVGQSLPPEVIRSCVESGKSLLSAYTENETRILRARVDELSRENSILRMNAEAAERAPVRSASLMGSPEAEESDPFLLGFND